MKKLLVLIIIFLIFNSCEKKSEKVDILVTIYPFKFILDEIVKDELKIDVLLPASVDPHTYELVPSDLIKMQNAQLFIYGDKDLDGWASKFDVKNKIQFSDYLPDCLKMDISESLFITNKQLHHHNHHHSHAHTGFDPHFWTDPVTVQGMVENIVLMLSEFFPDKKNTFIKNAKLFKTKLSEIDSTIILKTNLISNKNVFTSHPFYNYFFKRYKFNIVGFLEVSPGQALSPKEMKNIMKLVKENDVKAIFTNKQHSDKTTKILAESVGIKYFDLDPIGGTNELNNYFSILNYNLKIIEQALK